jgi:hypothetical protein
MKNTKRILIALAILVGLSALVLGVDWWQRQFATQAVGTSTPLPAGSVPVYFNGKLMGGITPVDLEKLEKVSFTDVAEGVLQDGWLLKDILSLYIEPDQLKPETKINVTSTSRNKSAELTWAELSDPANMVMFDLSNRGTLKLVSLMPKLDDRDEWVQDADRIEVTTP